MRRPGISLWLSHFRGDMLANALLTKPDTPLPLLQKHRPWLFVHEGGVAPHRHPALRDPAQGGGVNHMFLRQHPLRQLFRCVIGLDRDLGLDNQRAVIQVGPDEMHGAAMLCFAGGKGAGVSVQPPEVRQQ